MLREAGVQINRAGGSRLLRPHSLLQPQIDALQVADVPQGKFAQELPCRHGRLKFKADDWGFGGNAEVLVEPNPRLRFGLTYRSQVDMSYTDRIRFTHVGPVLQRVLKRGGVMGGETTLDQTTPQTVMASWYYALTDNSAVMGNCGWQNWQQYSDVGISVDSGTTTRTIQANQHLHDTWHQALGVQSRFARLWVLSAGFAHDSAPVFTVPVSR